MGRDRPGGEPTEKPTARRLREARKKGQVARSRDLSGLAVFSAVAGTALVTAPWWAAALAGFVRDCLGGATLWPEEATGAVLGRAMDMVLLACGPALAAGAAAALVAGLFQVRFLWTTEPLKPKLSKLNPIQGLRQMVSLRRLVDLIKSLGAITALSVVSGVTLWEALPSLLALTGAAPEALMAVLGRWIGVLFLRGALVLLVVAAVDYGLQRYRHEKDLRMTKDEVKREHKQSEGDPQHKAARKRLHQEILEHDMVERVRTADLVVVNPTRIAVALRYDEAKDEAPRVVAKGESLMAARIREVARQAKVPIFHDVSLARALHSLEAGDEIPEALYLAVADLLRAVAQETGGSHEG